MKHEVLPGVAKQIVFDTPDLGLAAALFKGRNSQPMLQAQVLRLTYVL